MKALLRMTAVLTLASAALCASAEDAASTYKAKCAACHGAAGDANTPAGKALKVPSFSSEEAVKQSDAVLLEIAKNGKGKMPAWHDKLSDVQLKDLVVFIHGLQKKS
jgi:mono/diheme cytochrome c family protein